MRTTHSVLKDKTPEGGGGGGRRANKNHVLAHRQSVCPHCSQFVLTFTVSSDKIGQRRRRRQGVVVQQIPLLSQVRETRRNIPLAQLESIAMKI